MHQLRNALVGGLAGICATLAMTAVARRMHRNLPADERYPLPPTELARQIMPASDAHQVTTGAIGSHFAFGALAGAIFRCVPALRAVPSPLYGVGVWAVSYFGWIPALGLLKPATKHPARRNGLMIAAHLVWGAALSICMREIEAATGEGLDSGKTTHRLPPDAR